MSAAIAGAPTAEQERMVLRELRQAGARGVHSHDLARRLPILNVPERIRRLRKAGWVIGSTRERSPFGTSWGTRYRLDGPLPIAVVPEERSEHGGRPTLEPDVAARAAEIPRAA